MHNYTVYKSCVYELMPCTIIYYRLKYDVATKHFSNNTNVNMISPDFGGTRAIEYMSTGLLNLDPYLNEMIKYFVDRGYKRGESIRGAPYDWRLAGGENSYS